MSDSREWTPREWTPEELEDFRDDIVEQLNRIATAMRKIRFLLGETE